MEPVDLIGSKGQIWRSVQYTLRPRFYPRKVRACSFLKNAIRAPRYVQVPALQLLTARQLNDFVFPKKWLPCAAVNDGEEYQVDLLDPALLSRFLKARIEPDPVEWLKWARTLGDVHAKVVEFIEQTPSVFADPDGNPRAWTYASNLLKQWEAASWDQDLLAPSAGRYGGRALGDGLS